MKRKKKVDVVITAHAEGILAHASLCAFEASRLHVEDADIRFVLILDSASQETRDVIARCPAVRSTDMIIQVEHGDLGLSRNTGIQSSDADYLCILDADDLIGKRYFSSHLEAAGQATSAVVLHPEIIVCFGKYNSFNWQFHQPAEYFDPHFMLTTNCWASPSFSERSIYEDVPYSPCRTKETGFGYEDWHWNCETIASGYVHELAWGSVYFYRRKHSMSMNASATELKAVIPPSRLFENIGLQGGMKK